MSIASVYRNRGYNPLAVPKGLLFNPATDKNGIVDAYSGKVVLGGTLVVGANTHVSGNCKQTGQTWGLLGGTAGKVTHQPVTTRGVYIPTSGVNIVTLTNKLIPFVLCGISFCAAGLSSSMTTSAFKLMIDAAEYTLYEAAGAGLIDYIVLTGGPNSNYVYPSWQNIYNGGSSGSGSYPWGYLIFTPLTDKINKVKFTASAAWNSQYDSWEMYSFPNAAPLTVIVA